MTTKERLMSLLERRPEISPAQILSLTTVNKSTFYKWLEGKPHVSGASFDAEMEELLNRIDSDDILALSDHAITVTEDAPAARKRVRRQRDFYVTSTAEKISQVLTYCADQAAIGVITGDYGVGKTESLRFWMRKKGREIDHFYFEFDEFSARNIVTFIDALADRLGLETGKRGSSNAGRTFRAICEQLNRTAQLVILDQCEACAPRVLQIIRQIWDSCRESGCGVVLLASPLLMAKLQRSQMKDIGALTSRVGVWAQLRGVSREEAMNIVRQEGLQQIADDAFDLLWKATGGSMRRLMAVTDLLVSKHGNKAITAQTIAGVAGHLWGLTIGGGIEAA